MSLSELYQQLILDHNRSPRNRGRLETPTHSAVGHNPLCGDQLQLQLQLKDGKVAEVAFEGSGCAISTASASRVRGSRPHCALPRKALTMMSWRSSSRSFTRSRPAMERRTISASSGPLAEFATTQRE